MKENEVFLSHEELSAFDSLLERKENGAILSDEERKAYTSIRDKVSGSFRAYSVEGGLVLVKEWWRITILNSVSKIIRFECECSNCKKQIDDDYAGFEYPNYCKYCGQKLDWSDE